MTKQTPNKATSMADLMRSVQPSFVTIHKGDLIKGKITRLSVMGIAVDINAKTEAIVLEKDKRILRNLLNNLKVGDEVTVSVLNAESDMGHPVVSLRRYIDDMQWEVLAKLEKEKKPVNITVTESTKGGFLVDTPYGISGFLPNSQLTLVATEGNYSQQIPQELIGKTVLAYIAEVNRTGRKLIFSQKPSISTKDFDSIVRGITNGQKIDAIISTLTSFGMFVTIPVNEKMVDGLIHISEISWNDVKNIADDFSVGQKVQCVVIGKDMEAKRLDLSIKKLIQDPLEAMYKNIAIDQKVTGTVSKMTSTGVVVDILGIVEGQTIEAVMRKEKLPPTVSYEIGKEITATVTQVDVKKHKVYIAPILKEKPIGYR